MSILFCLRFRFVLLVTCAILLGIHFVDQPSTRATLTRDETSAVLESQVGYLNNNKT